MGELKGLMPMLTEEQAHFVMAEIELRDDPTSVRRAVHAYVADHEQFGIAAFKAMLPPKPDEPTSIGAQLTADQQRERRAIGEQLDREHAADQVVCDSLDDPTFERVALLVMREAIEPEIATIYARKPLRHWKSIKALVAKYARENGLASPSVRRLV